MTKNSVAGPSLQAWGDVLTMGASLLSKLGESLRAAEAPANTRPNATPGAESQPAASPWITRDETTGQTYLRLPLPAEETLAGIVDLLSSLTRKR